MNVKFFVGTKLDELLAAAGDRQVVMLDGTVPGWEPKPWGINNLRDVHYDHHRKGGAKVQIDEMKELFSDGWGGSAVIADVAFSGEPILFATTQLDADACVAAAYYLVGGTLSPESLRKLRAIAFDCDHLSVPEDLADLKDFAFKAVATFIQPAIREAVPTDLGIDPKDFKNWTLEQRNAVSAESFRRSTEWLVSAALGLRPWPGESGEADGYAAEIEKQAQMLIDENRVALVQNDPNGMVMAYGDGSGHAYLNPRSFYRAWEMAGIDSKLSLTSREHKSGATTYTIAAVGGDIDLTDGYFEALTAAERNGNPEADPWGGRETVGGSGWNTGSMLTPTEVLAAVESHSY